MSLKISSRVLEFGILIGFTSAIGFGYAKAFGQTDDEKEAMLRQKYPDLIKQSQANRKPMQDFFDSMKAANNADNKVIDGLLRKGKSNPDKRQGPNVGVEDVIRPLQNPAIVSSKEKSD
jgi:hypothetical protein